MIRREYGRTGKQCSIVGFGGMRFQQVEDTELCVQMMVEAARGGINYFDTAPLYCADKSEDMHVTSALGGFSTKQQVDEKKQGGSDAGSFWSLRK